MSVCAQCFCNLLVIRVFYWASSCLYFAEQWGVRWCVAGWSAWGCRRATAAPSRQSAGAGPGAPGTSPRSSWARGPVPPSAPSWRTADLQENGEREDMLNRVSGFDSGNLFHFDRIRKSPIETEFLIFKIFKFKHNKQYYIIILLNQSFKKLFQDRFFNSRWEQQNM